jgi:hypothetical protein
LFKVGFSFCFDTPITFCGLGVFYLSYEVSKKDNYGLVVSCPMYCLFR